MTILLGLLLLGTSLTLTVVGVLTSTAGPGLLPGIGLGVIGMVGLRLVHGDIARRSAARQLGRLRTHLLHELRVVARDRDRLARELVDQRAGAVTG